MMRLLKFRKELTSINKESSYKISQTYKIFFVTNISLGKIKCFGENLPRSLIILYC